MAKAACQAAAALGAEAVAVPVARVEEILSAKEAKNAKESRRKPKKAKESVQWLVHSSHFAFLARTRCDPVRPERFPQARERVSRRTRSTFVRLIAKQAGCRESRSRCPLFGLGGDAPDVT